ncbi:MAG: hypothetical protein AB9872_02490 [Solidesulfovibrio sp.]
MSDSDAINMLDHALRYAKRGTVCPVVWEDGGREAPSCPIPRRRD